MTRNGPQAHYGARMHEPLIINVADAPAFRRAERATRIQFEPEYHSEPVQEDFLVLHGECLVILDGEERTLRQWDFVHCPAGTEHVFVGAGDGPCAVLMIGSRREVAAHYPLNEVAARYDASVTRPTDDPVEAYADWRRAPRRETRNPWPLA